MVVYFKKYMNYINAICEPKAYFVSYGRLYLHLILYFIEG